MVPSCAKHPDGTCRANVEDIKEWFRMGAPVDNWCDCSHTSPDRCLMEPCPCLKEET